MFKMLRPGHRILLSVLTLYLLALACVVLWPTPVDQTSGQYLKLVLDWLHVHGIPLWFNYSVVEWLSNVVMFLPFGFLVAQYFKNWRVSKTILLGLIVSAVIESAQFLFFEQRTASVLDILANTLGTFLGSSIFVVFTFLRQKHVSVVNGVPGSLVGDSSVDPEKN